MKEIKAYKCEFCSKLYERAHAIKFHEIRCAKNPENDRICFSCVLLHKKPFTIDYDSGYDYKLNLFFCDKVDSFLYPASVEHKGNAFETHDVANQPMKKECNYFIEDTIANNIKL